MCKNKSTNAIFNEIDIFKIYFLKNETYIFYLFLTKYIQSLFS